MGRCVPGKTLSRYLDGDLPPAAGARIREHLAECDCCARSLADMQNVDETVRRSAVVAAETPDLAARVTDELQRRGAFLRARMAAGKRRLVGGPIFSGRVAAALAVAASLTVLGIIGLDYLTRDAWARRTAPVLADAERVLVRLVYVDPPQESSRLAWARDEARKLSLSARLAEARAGAKPAQVSDLAYLQETFARLADGQPLPAAFLSDLNTGEALERAVHLRENLTRGG